jgi:hypothetical protein
MSDQHKVVKRRDATGHLDPRYSRELLEKAREGHDESEQSSHAFISGTAPREELADELGESFVESATSGEEQEQERHERTIAAESGGPFVPTSGSQEFAGGTDESNIADATREPFPRTSNTDG